MGKTLTYEERVDKRIALEKQIIKNNNYILTHLPKLTNKMINLMESNWKKYDRSRSVVPTFYGYYIRRRGELYMLLLARKALNRSEKTRKVLYKIVGIHPLSRFEFLSHDIYSHAMGGWQVDWRPEGIETRHVCSGWCQYVDRIEDYVDYGWCAWSSKTTSGPSYVALNPNWLLSQPEFKYYPEGTVSVYSARLHLAFPEYEMVKKLDINFSSTYGYLKAMHNNIGFRKYVIRHKEELRCVPVNLALRCYKLNLDTADELRLFQFKVSMRDVYRYAPRNLFKEHNIDMNRLYKLFVRNGLDTQATWDNSIVRMYTDYLDYAEKLNFDFTHDNVLYPHNIRFAHDNAREQWVHAYEIAHAKEIAAEKKRKQEEAKILAKVAKKYFPLQLISVDFSCLIAKSVDDMLYESDHNHNCVGHCGYDRKMRNEQSLIFFVRKSDTPTESLVTMEYDLKKNAIAQMYAEHNSPCPPEVKDFINNTWLPYMTKELKKINKKSKKEVA